MENGINIFTNKNKKKLNSSMRIVLIVYKNDMPGSHTHRLTVDYPSNDAGLTLVLK